MKSVEYFCLIVVCKIILMVISSIRTMSEHDKCIKIFVYT